MFSLSPRHIIQLPSAKALAVAISPDAALCAAGDRDGVIHIIDTESGQVLRKLRPHVEFVYTLAFNPDNGHLVSAGKDKSIREWDCKTGQFIKDYAGIFISQGARTLGAQSFKPTTRSHKMTILSIALEKNGLMATGSQDTYVKFWKDGEPVRTYDWHRGPVTCVRFQPETNILFSASKDKDIRSWNDVNGALIHKYTGHLAEIVGLEFMNRNDFVSVDASGQVISWNVDSEKPVETIYDAQNRIQCATWIQAAQTLLLGFENGTIQALQINDPNSKINSCFSCAQHNINVRCIQATNSGLAASCDNAGKVILWNYSA